MNNGMLISDERVRAKQTATRIGVGEEGIKVPPKKLNKKNKVFLPLDA